MITWDFDVMKGDVQFTVFRHKRPREAISSNSLSSFGSDASINQSGVIAGVDAMVVEKPRHCVDGESIQVCFYKGGYTITLSFISETASCLVGQEKCCCCILDGMKMLLSVQHKFLTCPIWNL